MINNFIKALGEISSEIILEWSVIYLGLGECFFGAPLTAVEIDVTY